MSRRPPRRAGLGLIEVVVATMVLAAVAIPLFTLFRTGVRATHATIHEILATHLAAELAEQLETVPFDELAADLGGDERVYDSDAGELVDGGAIGETSYAFHVSPLPPGFARQVTLRRAAPTLIYAAVEVTWRRPGGPPRTVELRRALTRDRLVP